MTGYNPIQPSLVQTNMPRGRRFSLSAATVLAGLALPGMAFAQAGATWTTERGDPQGTGYSSLSEINSTNAANLVEEFAVPTNTFQNHEGNPLVVGNMMYSVTPWPNNLIAIDLTKKGKVAWTYVSNAAGGARAQACCDFDNRGPAYAAVADGAPNADGLIIFNTLDGFMHAVDAVTGQLVWKTQLANNQIGETLTGAPILAKGIAIVGNSGAEDGVRGAVYGVNVTNGVLVWKAYNTGPDADVLIGPNFHPFYAKDQGTNLGQTSWNGGNWWQQGGATAWGYKTYDPVTDLVYYGTGNADPWLSYTRGGTGDAKWAATIFARRPETGEAIWAYQVSPNDNWDFDSISESVVADIPVNGVTRHSLFHVDKNGYGYVLDAATGQVLVAGDVFSALGGSITWAHGVNLKTGKPNVDPAHVIDKFGKQGPANCPYAGGVKDPQPIAYSFQTGWFYIAAHNGCMTLAANAANWIVGTPFTAFAGNFGIQSPGVPGALVAWNAGAGKAAWVANEKYALWSGVLATAGNLVFYGTLSNGTDTPSSPTLIARDATNGNVVWSATLECNTVASPMSFMGADGHQRIAMFTGTGGTGAAGTGKCPNLTIFDPSKHKLTVDRSPTQTWLHQEIKVPSTTFKTDVTSGYIHVFKLP